MENSNSTEGDVYDVERIVDDRMYKGKRQYLIKWVGYADSENTWEFEENLLCDELLVDYKDKKKRKSTEPVVTKQSEPKLVQEKKQSEPKFVQEKKQPEPKFVQENTISQKITNEWDEQIVSVDGAFMGKNGCIEVEFTLKDGTKCTATNKVMRYKAPIKLIEFYEENLSFPE